MTSCLRRDPTWETWGRSCPNQFPLRDSALTSHRRLCLSKNVNENTTYRTRKETCTRIKISGLCLVSLGLFLSICLIISIYVASGTTVPFYYLEFLHFFKVFSTFCLIIHTNVPSESSLKHPPKCSFHRFMVISQRNILISL